MPFPQFKYLLPLLVIILSLSWVEAQKASITYLQDLPQAQFASEVLSTSLNNNGLDVVSQFSTEDKDLAYQIGLFTLRQKKEIRALGFKVPEGLKEEGFSLQHVNNKIAVIGYDPAGLMYGGLELAEQIHVYGIDSLKDITENPYFSMRGTKFNIPLDARTPSYSDLCDAGQKNIPEMWSLDFWYDYIDHLALYRYNFISLWNLHPFPSMVKVSDYPDIALEDVMRSTGDLKEDYSLEGTGLDAPEILNHLETVKKMTIQEKINFWKEVMRYGKSRNVDFYIITWNIFDYGVNNKYGITDDFRNEVTRDYFRKSVEAMVQTYPDLKGIGLTTGENMYGASFEEKEDWAFDTYARGMMDGLKGFPGRKMTFVHRQHYAGAKEIASKFKPLIDHPDIEFIYSFKYAKAHVYSAVEQTFHEGFVNDIQEMGDLKTIWTLRNDDIYYFRWGAPDFVREFLLNIPYDVSRGFYYGSDQYIWGRDFLDRYPSEQREIEVRKHWYQWMLWGRLGYNPDLNNERITGIIGSRFPEVEAEAMFEAWQSASMVYPLTTGFHWGALDFQWYIEGCQSRDLRERAPYRYNNINDFINLTPHPGSENISITEFTESVIRGESPQGRTPYEVADELISNAHQALNYLRNIKSVRDPELQKILSDIQSMAYMGLFYGYKIRAATDLHLFRIRGSMDDRKKAIANLKESIVYFKKYASNAMKMNKNPLWTNRVGHVDWRKTYDWALYDLQLIGADLSLNPEVKMEGEWVIEAENARMEHGTTGNHLPGYSGSGYIVEGSHIRWVFDVPESGFYDLKFRYTIRWGSGEPVELDINGNKVEPFYFWSTGDAASWAVDGQTYFLKEGENAIEMDYSNRVHIDQIAIEKSPVFSYKMQ